MCSSYSALYTNLIILNNWQHFLSNSYKFNINFRKGILILIITTYCVLAANIYVRNNLVSTFF